LAKSKIGQVGQLAKFVQSWEAVEGQVRRA